MRVQNNMFHKFLYAAQEDQYKSKLFYGAVLEKKWIDRTTTLIGS